MTDSPSTVPSDHVISLRAAPGERAAWDRPAVVVYAWGVVELLFVSNPLQISSRLRVAALRAFGATIGERVVFRPRTRVRFPWKLSVGDDCWIGEGVWFHNQDRIELGHDVVVSQDTLLTTGSHAAHRDMALVTRPITVHDGAWLTARSIVLGGANVGRSAVVTPGTVVRGEIPPETVWGRADAGPIGTLRPRFAADDTPSEG